MNRGERVAALMEGLREVPRHDPDGLQRALDYHERVGRFASDASIVDSEGFC